MKTFLVNIMMIFGLCGCSLFQGITPESTASIIRTAASTSVLIGVEEGCSGNDQLKAQLAYTICNASEMALDVLKSDLDLDAIGVNILLNETLHVDEVTQMYLKNVTDLILSHIKIPSADEFLSPESRLYLTAFFEGTLQGSKILLDRYNDLIPEFVDRDHGNRINDKDSVEAFENFKSIFEE